MKKYILMAFVFVSAIFAGCTKVDPFEGGDNYITGFQFEKNPFVYDARIVGTRMEMTVPYDFEFSGTVVKYQLSELASIAPDPLQVDFMGGDVQFTVTSHSGLERVYTLKVVRSERPAPGSVVIVSKEELDQLNASGIELINGDMKVAIEGEPQTLEFSHLKEVAGSVIFAPATALDSLSFPALESAGNIYAGSTSEAFNTETPVAFSFPKLQKTGELVLNGNKIASFEAPALKEVYSMRVNAESLQLLELSALETSFSNVEFMNLKQLPALGLAALKEVQGNFSLNRCMSEEFAFTALAKIGNGLTVDGCSKLLAIDFPELSSVGGNVILKGCNVADELSFAKLESCGKFEYLGSYNRIMKSFSIPALKRVNGDFHVTGIGEETLELPVLESIAGKMEIAGMDDIKNFLFPALTSCKSVDLSYANQIKALDFSKIENLETLEIVSPYILETLGLPKEIRDLTLNGGGSSSVKFPVISGNEKVTGTFYLSNYEIGNMVIAGLKSISHINLPSLRNVKSMEFPDLTEADHIEIGLYSLTTLKMPKLAKTRILDFTMLQLVDTYDLSSLKEITEKFIFWGSTYAGGAGQSKTTNLDFMSSVEKIGSVDIKWCGNLVDFSGLKNALPSIKAENWNVVENAYNPTYQDMLDGKYTAPIE